MVSKLLNSKLILDEYPLVIIPSLAVEYGLNEAIIIQQLHYWIQKSSKEKDGRKWVYNTYENWQEQFPFWSLSTIKRTIKKLEKENIVITANYNKMTIDNTKWYTLNYGELDMSRPLVQNEQTIGSKWTDQQVKMNKPITRDYTETTSENKRHHVEILEYLNKKAKTSYKPTTKKTQSLINARLSEGFTVEDFKRVIDIKTTEWLKDAKMSQYLRPTTLFGTNFEGYLNQPQPKGAPIPRKPEKTNKYSPEQVKAIQELRDQGLSVEEIKGRLNL